jgi:two-component system sensor histidine kinase VanS
MTGGPASTVRVSARLRLALSYAVFLVAAGAVVLLGVYVVLRYVPNYPLTAANPQDAGTFVATRQQILSALVGVSAIALAGLAIIGIVGGWFLAGWVLKPLRRINEAAVIVASGDLRHRIRLGGRNDEFRQLADAFDHMLARLHEAFEVQERFAANASHELRTPLAVTATMLEVAARRPNEQDYPRLLERLRITNDRAVELTEALLRLADADAIGAVAEEVDLADLLRTTIEDEAGEAERRSVTITPRLEAATVLGDPGLLAQLVTNLVQNAIRHSGSGGSARVTTRSDQAHGKVQLLVESTGSTFTPEEAARLAEPLLRGSGRVAGSEKGHGLGLALVHRIARVHDGSLIIAPRDGGGLVITVELPAVTR